MFRFLFTLSLISVTSLVFSDDASVITLSAGPAWYRAGQAQTFELVPGFFNTYTADKTTQSLASGELFVGVQRVIHTRLSGQLGVAGASYNPAHLSGTILETADPTFDNFSYTYKVRHQRIAVKGLLLYSAIKQWLPYLSGSAGMGFNKAYQFTITPNFYTSKPPPAFQSNNTTAFSYTLGIGVRKVLNPHLHIGVGYEFADWGKSIFNRGDGQTLNNGVQLNHLLTNELQFSLSCLI